MERKRLCMIAWRELQLISSSEDSVMGTFHLPPFSPFASKFIFRFAAIVLVVLFHDVTPLFIHRLTCSTSEAKLTDRTNSEPRTMNTYVHPRYFVICACRAWHKVLKANYHCPFVNAPVIKSVHFCI